MPQPVRPFWPCSTCHLIKAVVKIIRGVLYNLLRPLIPYESGPRAPEKELPEEVGEVADGQFALCQAIFDDSRARRARIEQKAQWTFTAIAFLIPTLISIIVFLIREPAFGAVDYALSLMILSVSGFLLILSLISALRGIAIRPSKSLYIHAVIDEEYGGFLKYKKESHAQGLLYCATMNEAMNDHLAQFVKSAHILLAIAVIVFTLGVIVTGFQRTARTVPPSKTDIVGAGSLSPNVLSELYSDIREMVEADRAAIVRTENQMKLLSDRVVTLEAEVNALWN